MILADVEVSPRRMLNIGCGHRFHADWVNVDIAPQHPTVTRLDLAKGLPFPDRHFDVVYHSHVVEHVRRPDVPAFLNECFRVLKPLGILRIATPDLERLCETYLEKLRGGPEADREWIVLEMFDQTVRERSGGSMLEYLRRDSLPNEPFVIERIGEEGRELLASIRGSRQAPTPSPRPTGLSRPAAFLRRRARQLRERLIVRWYGEDALQAMGIGKFRLSGEVHHWLYDRASLSGVLTSAGFLEPVVCAAGESAIPDWRAFHLEVNQSGHVIKPDSIFVEARRPQ